jgi:nucleotide-binding universal stress UspA family protein
MFRRILLASDLRSTSASATRVAAALAQKSQATLVALHVLQPPRGLTHWAEPKFLESKRAYRAMLVQKKATAIEQLTKQLRAKGAPAARVLVEAGVEAEVIARVASRLKAEVIVVGTRGHSFPIGSVAERVVRTAGRPILLVPKESPGLLRLAAVPKRPQAPIRASRAKVGRNIRAIRSR